MRLIYFNFGLNIYCDELGNSVSIGMYIDHCYINALDSCS
jgi:hypothetical protein